MRKDFDNWNIKKKATHNSGPRPYYHEREVWWCSLGVNIGSEQDGTGENFDRPVVIFKSFNKELFMAVALTGKRKTGKYYLPVGFIDGREATAILSQVRLVDAKRLIKKITVLDEQVFTKLKTALQAVLFGSTSCLLPCCQGGEAEAICNSSILDR